MSKAAMVMRKRPIQHGRYEVALPPHCFWSQANRIKSSSGVGYIPWNTLFCVNEGISTAFSALRLHPQSRLKYFVRLER